MKQFCLIDPAWQRDGDHHGELGVALVRAALQRGYQGRVGVHRRFQGDLAALAPATCVRVFPRSSYQACSLLAGMQAIKRGGLARPQQPPATWSWRSPAAAIRNRVARWFRRRYAHDLAAALQAFFDGYSFSAPTTILFASTTDVDLEGIGSFLRAHPPTIQAEWHFLFHFNLFSGRTPNYEQQRWRLEQVRKSFYRALVGLPYHQLFFHATTDNLCDQYNRLGVAQFTEFPYPISRSLDRAEEQTPEPSYPLRLSCLGGVRREKRQRSYLQSLVDAIWDKHLATSRVSLQVQTRLRTYLARTKLTLVSPAGHRYCTLTKTAPTRSRRVEEEEESRPLRLFAHPLGRADYETLLKQTDCGLLLYDAETYFARRAGIFDELISLGRPVIVSAGSWLADQLSRPQFEYVQQMARHDSLGQTFDWADMVCGADNLPLDGSVLSFDGGRHPFELTLDLNPDDALVGIQFHWRYPLLRGTYVRLTLSAPSPLRSTAEAMPPFGESGIVGHPRYDAPTGALLRIPPACRAPRRLRLSFVNAFDSGTICLEGLKLFTLTDDQLPLSAAGLVVGQAGELPGAVNEMVAHYEHYRETAERVAERVRNDHHPSRAFDWLVGKIAPARRAA